MIEAQAQIANLGFRAGISQSRFYGSDYKDTSAYYSSVIQPTIGIFVNYYLSKNWWVKTEFNFMNRSFDRKDELDNKFRENFYYIDIHPVTPAYHYKGFQLFIGPAVSLLVTSKKDSLNSVTNDIITYGDANLIEKNRYDLGFVAGMEYEFRERYNIGFRYTRGFTPIYQTAVNASSSTKWFNESFLLTLGYSIGIKSHASNKDGRVR
jgi:hypothetical protein